MNKCVDGFSVPFTLTSLNYLFTDIQFAVITKTEIAAKDIWMAQIKVDPERLN